MKAEKFISENLYIILSAYKKNRNNKKKTYNELTYLDGLPEFGDFQKYLAVIAELNQKGLLKPAPSTRIRAPRSYRGWTLNSRGTNRSGRMLYNMVKRIGGKNRVKYLGPWNPEKADRIVTEADREYSADRPVTKISA